MTSCPYCGFVAHDDIRQCPAIKAIEYYPDGMVKRVEKFPLLQPSDSDTWPKPLTPKRTP